MTTPISRLRDTSLSHFACIGCGYGASRATAPERCPMCGDTVWDDEPWRPFAGFLYQDVGGVVLGDEYA